MKNTRFLSVWKSLIIVGIAAALEAAFVHTSAKTIRFLNQAINDINEWGVDTKR
jgi:hypothetical protein